MIYFILGIILGTILSGITLLLTITIIKKYSAPIQQFLERPVNGRAEFLGYNDEENEVIETYKRADETNQTIILD